ncbi:uncharacterized protein LOC143024626 isoform X2 [Oratosquilla oratoria]|uniref:uncharacterized protein LOC143024626 isoform X2 n=1 Tax=Oratosquilla oratoria TaxID=337810 RepID=UPI003F75E90B
MNGMWSESASGELEMHLGKASDDFLVNQNHLLKQKVLRIEMQNLAQQRRLQLLEKAVLEMSNRSPTDVYDVNKLPAFNLVLSELDGDSEPKVSAKPRRVKESPTVDALVENDVASIMEEFEQNAKEKGVLYGLQNMSAPSNFSDAYKALDCTSDFEAEDFCNSSSDKEESSLFSDGPNDIFLTPAYRGTEVHSGYKECTTSVSYQPIDLDQDLPQGPRPSWITPTVVSPIPKAEFLPSTMSPVEGNCNSFTLTVPSCIQKGNNGMCEPVYKDNPCDIEEFPMTPVTYEDGEKTRFENFDMPSAPGRAVANLSTSPYLPFRMQSPRPFVRHVPMSVSSDSPYRLSSPSHSISGTSTNHSWQGSHVPHNQYHSHLSSPRLNSVQQWFREAHLPLLSPLPESLCGDTESQGSDEEDMVVDEAVTMSMVVKRERSESVSSLTGLCMPPDLIIDNSRQRARSQEQKPELNDSISVKVEEAAWEFTSNEGDSLLAESPKLSEVPVTPIKTNSDEAVDMLQVTNEGGGTSKVKSVQAIPGNKTLKIDGKDVKLPAGSIILAVVNESGSLVPLPQLPVTPQPKVVASEEVTCGVLQEEEVDVETIGENTPVLEAGDLDSLLAQFEASEAVNGNTGSTPVTTKDAEPSNVIQRNKLQTSGPQKRMTAPTSPTHQKIKDALPKEIIEKIRASTKRKSTQILTEPLMVRKGRAVRAQDVMAANNKGKNSRNHSTNASQSQQNLGEQRVPPPVDHDYCFTPDRQKKGNSGNSNDPTNKEEYYSKLPEYYTTIVPRREGQKSNGSSDEGHEHSMKKDSGVESGDVSDASVETEDKTKEKRRRRRRSSKEDTEMFSKLPAYVTDIGNSKPKDTVEEGEIGERKDSIDIPAEEPKVETKKVKRKLKLSEYRMRVQSAENSRCASPVLVDSAVASPVSFPNVGNVTTNNNNSGVSVDNSGSCGVTVVSDDSSVNVVEKVIKTEPPVSVQQETKKEIDEDIEEGELQGDSEPEMEPKVIAEVTVQTTGSTSTTTTTTLPYSPNSLASITLNQNTSPSQIKTDGRGHEKRMNKYKASPNKTSLGQSASSRESRKRTRSSRSSCSNRSRTCSSRYMSSSSRSRSRSCSPSSSSSRRRRNSRSHKRSRRHSRSSSPYSRRRHWSRSRSSSISSCSTCSSSRSRSRSSRYRERSRDYARRYSRSRDCRRRSRSRSRSRTPPKHFRLGRSRSPIWGNRGRSPLRTMRPKRLDDDRIKQVEERRVVYIGRISEGTTKLDLRSRFEKYGPIVDISVHFREHGDNYGFVTYKNRDSAYEAVEHGNDDKSLPHYDLCFGGRRAFCKVQYSDLDAQEPGPGIGSALGKGGANSDFDSMLFDSLLKVALKRKR